MRDVCQAGHETQWGNFTGSVSPCNMARPHRLRHIDTSKLIKAQSYLKRGYAQAMIAERLGLSRRTIVRYSQLLGFSQPSAATGLSPGETQRITMLQQQVRALSPRARRALLASVVAEHNSAR